MGDVIHEQVIEVRHEGDTVIMEPPAIHGTKGFSVYMTSDQAKALGYKLIGASTKTLGPTTKTGGM